jgi:pimeloyl-ACP methyl ester carboxylesterase
VNTNLDRSDVPARIQPHWAEVRVGDSITRYRRSGSGKVVLVLHDSPPEDGTWPDAVTALAARARLIEPCVAEPVEGFVTWLERFREGIGAEQVSIIAHGRQALPALQFTMLEPECVERLVLVTDRSSEELSIARAFAPERGEPRVPKLVLGRDQPAHSALASLVAFMNLPDTTVG